MEIVERIITGAKNNAYPLLKKSLRAYLRWNQVKVGITNNPEARALKHSPYRWKKMVLVYSSSSSRNVNDLESWLIEDFFYRLENERGGGGGPDGMYGPYYLYFLLR